MKLKKTAAIVLVLVLLCCAGVGIYAADYYHADAEAAAAMAPSDTVTVESLDDLLLFRPAEVRAGLIFYPGGKVEYTAYAPLMHMLALHGVLCVVPEMPLNLAVLDMDVGTDIPALVPEVETWYIGGHSLGGAMAASCVAEAEDFAGLVLLAAYSTADLSDSGLRVLSVYGSNDGVMDREKYEQYRENLPVDALELVIDGGNHALFGDYGVQDGDGDGYLSGLEQQTLTASAILELMSLAEGSQGDAQITYRAWVPNSHGKMLRSVVTLLPDSGEFVISNSMLSSDSSGTYTMEGDTLICACHRGTYVFRMTDSEMEYLGKEGDDLMAHSSVLDSSSAAEAVVPTGTIYHIQTNRMY